MEDKLAEYRRLKNFEFKKTKMKTSFVATSSKRGPSWTDWIPFYAIILRLLVRITQTEIAQRVANRLGQIPIIGHVNFLYFVLWLLFYGVMVEYGFGIVYLTSSIIGGIFLNLGKRRDGELSAYSVFNPNCQRLDGTFTSDDFERNVLHRSNE